MSKITNEKIREMFTENLKRELKVSKNIEVSVKELSEMINAARKETDEAVAKLLKMD